MIIYKITNLINSKIYIGKTTKTAKERFNAHINSLRYSFKKLTRLQKALLKYGVNNFKVEVIERLSIIDKNLLNEREIYWINTLQPEYNMTKGGDGGWINDQTGKRWKIKDTSKMKGWKNHNNPEWLNQISGGNNYQSKYIIHTPFGIFETWKDATDRAKQLRSEGCKSVVSDTNTLKKYCLNDITLNVESRRCFSKWRGKSTRELGFFVEQKL